MTTNDVVMPDRSVAPWAVILAGGDGVRLRRLTMAGAGDARPKRFCRLFGDETLLERTRRRVERVVRPDQQVIALSRRHESHYQYLLEELMPARLAVQPENRDTGPGILYALLRVRDLAGNVPVAVFPSDHYVDDDDLLARYVRRALDVVQVRPALVALIGIDPTSAETDYGWIKRRPTGLATLPDVFPVRRFVEKPSAEIAGTLMAHGCLWNSFMFVAWVDSLLGLIASTAPDLYEAFAPVRRRLGTADEPAVLDRIYGSLRPSSFSRRVLTQAIGRLVTLEARGLGWSDLGSPTRVIASLRATAREARSLSRVTAQVG